MLQLDLQKPRKAENKKISSQTERLPASNTEGDRVNCSQDLYGKELTLKTKKSEKSMKSNGSLINQLKELNIKRGSQRTVQTYIPIKNKYNRCHNKNKLSKELTSSMALTSTHEQTEIRHIKVNNSTDLSKRIIKTASSSTINKESKAIKFDEPIVKPSTVKNKNAVKVMNTKKELTIKNFDIGRKLGKGRFGNVYVAQDKATKFTLAIKIINIKQLKEAAMEAQLIEEIKLQMYCRHPNILKMYGYIRDYTNIYLLLYLGTGCLFKVLRSKKHFSYYYTAYYIKQIVESLKYLHSYNIIHRDIKPENILIVEGVLKLSDFGWSTYSPIDKRQTFCGTLDYVPPEIVKGDYYDEKVDIWSLGVLCYELATGRAPFEVPNDQYSTYGKILSVELKFPEHVSTDLRDLISKILVRYPRYRLSLNQIEKHPWFVRYSKVGRYISKEVWETWYRINH